MMNGARASDGSKHFDSLSSMCRETLVWRGASRVAESIPNAASLLLEGEEGKESIVMLPFLSLF